MIRSLAALLVTLTAAPAVAQGVFVPPPQDVVQSGAPLTNLETSLARDLRRYGFGGVDVRRLSATQRATIHHFAHSGRSEGDIRSHIASSLRRGLLQRGLDRISR